MTQACLPVFESIKLGWRLTKGAKWTFWCLIFLLLALELAFHTFHKIALYTDSSSALLLISTAAVVFYIAQAMLHWGLIYLGIKRADNLPVHADMGLYGFNIGLLFRMIGLLILAIAIFIIPALLILSPKFLLKQPTLMVAVPLVTHLAVFLLNLIGIILSIYLLARLYLAQAIVIGEGSAPWTAIAQSFARTRSNVWRLIGLAILNWLIIVVSIIPIGLGLIWSLPYLYINYGVVYKKLSSQH